MLTDRPLKISNGMSSAMTETHRFRRCAAILFASLLIATLLMGYVCFDQTFVADRLLPLSKSFLPWTLLTHADSDHHGQSEIHVQDTVRSLDYTFTLSDKVQHSYASASLAFAPENNPSAFADLSQYRHIRFNVKCSPANVLSFTAHTFDERFTNPNDAGTYRIPTTFFSCNDQWKRVEIDLQHMEIPEWWLNMHGISLSDRGYQLDQVSRLSFGVSLQSPRNIASSVKIADIELMGRDWGFLYAFLIFAVPLWFAYGLWFFKRHTKMLLLELEAQIQKDRPLIAYQQLTVEPHREREKNAVLHYMATEYANPDISLEAAISAIGINRTKLNTILKEEIGLTFSGYLNKLRLTEAARLLSEKPEANVAEIAFSVGYNNVTYFNKLFKNEYGCSPKTYKSGGVQERAAPADERTLSAEM
jgi:AraC-like DNA-binding protein